MGEYVTIEECFEHREKIMETNNSQNVLLARLDAEIAFLKKFMYSILGVLISGFASTIFAILNVGGM